MPRFVHSFIVKKIDFPLSNMWAIGISKGKDFPAWVVLITKSEELYDRILSLKKNIKAGVACLSHLTTIDWSDQHLNLNQP